MSEHVGTIRPCWPPFSNSRFKFKIPIEEISVRLIGLNTWKWKIDSSQYSFGRYSLSLARNDLEVAKIPLVNWGNFRNINQKTFSIENRVFSFKHDDDCIKLIRSEDNAENFVVEFGRRLKFLKSLLGKYEFEFAADPDEITQAVIITFLLNNLVD